MISTAALTDSAATATLAKIPSFAGSGMVKVEFPNVQAIRRRLADGSERVYYYHRPTQIRLPDDPRSPEFSAKVEALNKPGIQSKRAEARTFGALIEAYLASPAFRDLSPKTQRGYRRDLDSIRNRWGWGPLPVEQLEPHHVQALLDSLSDTPAAANALVRSLRLVLEWGRRRGWVKDNAAAKPGRLKTGDGHRPWEEHELETFEARWPLGSWERTAYGLLLDTAQRGGDVAKMTVSHVARGEVSVAQEKTGARVWLPQAQDLVAVLAAWMPAVEGLALFPGRDGRAIGVDRFRHRMRAAIRAAGLPDDCTTHGIRYTAATRVYDLTGDWAAVADITGHATMQMARKYSEKRRRTRATVERLSAWQRGRGTNQE